jgi:RNA polymerase sigma-32 factor
MSDDESQKNGSTLPSAKREIAKYSSRLIGRGLQLIKTLQSENKWDLPTVDDIETYLKQINQFPLLTPKEEYDLAVRYRKYNDICAAHKLITSNLRFVVKVAFEYKSYGVQLADLIQEGNIGLMMAVKKFDPEKGYRFISYAIWWIRAYIQNFIIKTWSLAKIGKVRKALESDKENERRYEVLAKDLDMTKENIMEMEQRMSARHLSLDTPFDDDRELTHLDLFQEESVNQEEALLQQQEKKIRERKLQNALRRLSEKEAYVIKNRIMADSPLTLQEIGNHLKLSRERVRQIESEALRKLRKEFGTMISSPLGHTVDDSLAKLLTAIKNIR